MFKKNIIKQAVALAVGATFLLGGGFCGCAAQSNINNADAPETVYQVGLLQSLTLGYYDGIVTVGELKKHGDFGIGTFEGVNGEMVILDGVCYQALGDGSVVVASDATTVPFSTVSFFDVDVQKQITAADFTALKTTLDGIVNEKGKNQFFMVKVDGTFDSIKVRSELAQKKPYRPLNEALKNDQREYVYENISGIMVAIYCPAYIASVNTPGWHFHFVSEDRTKGGHVLELIQLSGTASLDEIGGFEMYVPDNDDFNSRDLSQDLSKEIIEVEQ